MTIKIEYNNVSTFNHKKENKEKEKSKAPFNIQLGIITPETNPHVAK